MADVYRRPGGYRGQVEAAAQLVVTIDVDVHLARGLCVDALALASGANDVRYWRLTEVEGKPGEWGHAGSGESGPLAEMLRGIAATYRHSPCGCGGLPDPELSEDCPLHGRLARPGDEEPA